MAAKMINVNGMDIPLKVFRMLQMYYALQIEVNTGLRHSRGSVMKLAQQEHGCVRGTKRGVMGELKDKLAAEGVLV